MKVMIEKGAFYPERKHAGDAGLDLATPVDFEIPARGYECIDLKVHVAIPDGYYGKLESRSGMTRRGVVTMGGVIDSGYTGSVCVCLYNYNDFPMRFYAGDRITQMVVVPCLADGIEQAETLDATERGADGFGSTGA